MCVNTSQYECGQAGHVLCSCTPCLFVCFWIVQLIPRTSCCRHSLQHCICSLSLFGCHTPGQDDQMQQVLVSQPLRCHGGSHHCFVHVVLCSYSYSVECHFQIEGFLRRRFCLAFGNPCVCFVLMQGIRG